MLKINDKSPDFSGQTANGEIISNKDFAGKWLVVYFYPKDNTSGCTKEACSFRDSMEDITKLGAVVIGISPDSPSSHKKFIEKFNLNFYLISDETKEICQKFYALGEKSMYGKKYIGVIRSTFIISPDGLIKYANYKVKPENHAQQIIEELKKLQND
ncbi:MAG: thioredoxin-dependent thiol peroxidase [Ignavibacteria bacterium]|nr:thioredoxin-dependent thiol peroxidase [Ignavibacteria bacterium]